MPAQGTRRWFAPLLVVMVIAAVAAGIGLSRLRGAAAGPVAGGDPSSSAPSEPVVLDASPSAPADSASASASEPASAAKPTSKAPTHTAEAPAGPGIAYYRVASKPSCPSGTDKVQYEGQPVTLEWKVTDSEKATISVDGPGIYDTYGVKDSVTINFPCGDADPGSYATHTYTLTAIGPDGTKTRTITVKAKVNEIAAT